MALFGRDRRIGECLLLREERKSGLRRPTSESDPKRTSAGACGSARLAAARGKMLDRLSKADFAALPADVRKNSKRTSHSSIHH
jgi:hypothetical protein